MNEIYKSIKNRNIYLLFLFSFVIFYTNIIKPIFQAKQPKENTEKLYKNPFHENMWGVYIQKKQPLKSFSIFANLTKTNKYAYKWLINFLHKTGNNQKIASMVPIIMAAFPQIIEDDPDIGFMVSYAISASNITPEAANSGTPIAYNKDAMDILIPLNRKFPGHQQVAALISTLYDINNDPQNAISVTEKYLNMATSKPTDFLEYFKNSSRYLKIGDKKIALKNVKKCLELQPKFNNGWVLLATIDDQLDKTQEAINACKKALELTGPNKAIEYMIIRLFFKLKGAQHLANEFVMNKKCFENAIELLHQKKYDQALSIMDKCLSEQLNTPVNTPDKNKINNINNGKSILNNNILNNNKNSELIKIKLIKNKQTTKKLNNLPVTHKICKI